MIDEILDAEITVKAIGNQWYYSNATDDSQYSANGYEVIKVQAAKYSTSIISQDPNWVTGFTDAEGCFTVNVQIKKDGKKSISVTFKQAQDLKDINILDALKAFFGVGQITIHKKEARQVIMGYKNAIDYVLPHFDAYPQITQKHADFILWKEIVQLQNNRENQTDGGFWKVLEQKASLNNGLSEKLSELYPDIIPAARAEVFIPNQLNPFWISGFTAGDGSFMLQIKKSSNLKIGYQTQAVLNIVQHSRDKTQLSRIQQYFNCGHVYTQRENSRIVICKQDDIRTIIIPHYTKFTLMNIKQRSFDSWCKAVNIIITGAHQRQEGLSLIREQREKMRNISSEDLRSQHLHGFARCRATQTDVADKNRRLGVQFTPNRIPDYSLTTIKQMCNPCAYAVYLKGGKQEGFRFTRIRWPLFRQRCVLRTHTKPPGLC